MRAVDPFLKVSPSLGFFAIAVTVTMFACPFGRAAELQPSTSARIGHACGMLLGLSEGNAPYAACVESLTKSASANAAAMTSPPLVMVGLACGDIGFVQGTPAFDSCATDLRGTIESLNLIAR